LGASIDTPTNALTRIAFSAGAPKATGYASVRAKEKIMKDNVLTIYQLDDLNALPEIKDEMLKLQKLITIEVKQRHVPAVVGELAGMATKILLSDPMQAFATAVEIGGILWAIILSAKKAGKSLRIGKGMVKALLLSKLKDETSIGNQTEKLEFEEAFVWGPMETDPVSGFANELSKGWDGATCPIGYFMAVVIPRDRDRIRTFWYLLSASGEVSSSWTTQTMADRVPDFLKKKSL
jgi:hypothetical protein